MELSPDMDKYLGCLSTQFSWFYSKSVLNSKRFSYNDRHNTSFTLPIKMTWYNAVPHIIESARTSLHRSKKKKQFYIFKSTLIFLFLNCIHRVITGFLHCASAFQCNINCSTLWWYPHRPDR